MAKKGPKDPHPPVNIDKTKRKKRKKKKKKATKISSASTCSVATVDCLCPPITMEKEKKCKQSDCGFIFMCNAKTKPECYRYRVFGLPLGMLPAIKAIKPGTMLFLYDFDSKLLYGVYEATSNGTLDLEPTVFNGKFPSQIFSECLPLHETAFKVAIKDNYQGFKFKQQLSSTQVKCLMSLFPPLTWTTPPLISLVPSHIIQERFQQPANHPYPHPQGNYESGVHQIPAFQPQLPDTRSRQLVAPPRHDEYVPVAILQPPIQHQHAVLQPSLPHI